MISLNRNKMKRLFIIFSFGLLNILTVFGSDEIIILPGLRFQPTFKHYSGYLNGSDTRMLHYWFVESQNSSTQDPLVLWLNGGPGCSSLMGLLTENGPFQVTPQGYLIHNPYSWNKHSNVIYLESPSCIGFSYSTDGKCDASDDSTAILNINALKHFLIKFPQYKNREFYISGESYAGIYIPTLADKIISSNPRLAIQFKGIFIGNGLSSRALNQNGAFHFAYYHGLMSDRMWTETVYLCCKEKDPTHCDVTGNTDPICQSKILQVLSSLTDVNPYNIYDSCYKPSNDSAKYIWSKFDVKSNYLKLLITNGWYSHSNGHLMEIREMLKGHQDSLVIPCVDDRASTKYFNLPLVRLALHVPNHVGKWAGCSSSVNTKYIKTYENMTSQYKKLFQLKDFKIWIYNGDVDIVCSYLADEWFFEMFNQKVVSPRKPWFYMDNNHSQQIGGFVKIWEKFVLLTVKGSGHMVPTDKPKPAYHIFESFLKGNML